MISAPLLAIGAWVGGCETVRGWVEPAASSPTDAPPAASDDETTGRAESPGSGDGLGDGLGDGSGDEVVRAALQRMRPAGPTIAEAGDHQTGSQAALALRWAVGEDLSASPPRPCFADAWLQEGRVRRVVVHCGTEVLFDSERSMAYGAVVEAAVVFEEPHPREREPVTASHRWYEPPPPPPEDRFSYHLHVDRLAGPDGDLALDTQKGWLVLRHEGVLSAREHRLEFSPVAVERTGAPALLPKEFVPRATSMSVSAPPNASSAGSTYSSCRLEASVISAGSDGSRWCSAGLTCEVSGSRQTLLEDTPGPCELDDAGAPRRLAFVDDDGSPRLTADLETGAASLRFGAGELVELGREKLTGIPECDEYLVKYMRCIEHTMPEAAREATLQALEQSVEAWRTAAASAGAEALAESCKTASEAARRAFEASGCSW
jgi:hypothetical protein